mmetsp:Transcript_83072/g.230689  ORF Transcript_83072/g.230689 Transcript_83072/m.230689 type:complete len:257 (+) Transcript_83072:421-1191(+)
MGRPRRQQVRLAKVRPRGRSSRPGPRHGAPRLCDLVVAHDRASCPERSYARLPWAAGERHHCRSHVRAQAGQSVWPRESRWPGRQLLRHPGRNPHVHCPLFRDAGLARHLRSQWIARDVDWCMGSSLDGPSQVREEFQRTADRCVACSRGGAAPRALPSDPDLRRPRLAGPLRFRGHECRRVPDHVLPNGWHLGCLGGRNHKLWHSSGGRGHPAGWLHGRLLCRALRAPRPRADGGAELGHGNPVEVSHVLGHRAV